MVTSGYGSNFSNHKQEVFRPTFFFMLFSGGGGGGTNRPPLEIWLYYLYLCVHDRKIL